MNYYTSVAVTMVVLQAISLAAVLLGLALYPLRVLSPRDYESRLLYLLFSSLVCAVDAFILPAPLFASGLPPDLQACQAQGYLKVVANLASIIFTSLVILNCFLSVCTRMGIFILRRWQILLIPICFGVPFGIALWPLLAGGLGPDTYLCWFNSSSLPQQIVCYYVPLWGSFVVNISLVAVIFYKARKAGQGTPCRLILFPLVSFLDGLFSTFHKVYIRLTGHDLFILDLLDQSFFSLQGVFILIVYVLNPTVIRQISFRLGLARQPSPSVATSNSSKTADDQLIYLEELASQ